MIAIYTSARQFRYVRDLPFFSFFFLLVHPIYYLRPSFYLSLLIVVTQIRCRIAGSSPPLTTTVRSLHFHRENIFSFLSSSTRVELCLHRPYFYPSTSSLTILRSNFKCFVFFHDFNVPPGMLACACCGCRMAWHGKSLHSVLLLST